MTRPSDADGAARRRSRRRPCSRPRDAADPRVAGGMCLSAASRAGFARHFSFARATAGPPPEQQQQIDQQDADEQRNVPSAYCGEHRDAENGVPNGTSPSRRCDRAWAPTRRQRATTVQRAAAGDSEGERDEDLLTRSRIAARRLVREPLFVEPRAKKRTPRACRVNRCCRSSGGHVTREIASMRRTSGLTRLPPTSCSRQISPMSLPTARTDPGRYCRSSSCGSPSIVRTPPVARDGRKAMPCANTPRSKSLSDNSIASPCPHPGVIGPLRPVLNPRRFNPL